MKKLILTILTITFLAVGCSNNDENSYNYRSSSNLNSYSNNSEYNTYDYEREELEPENPYSTSNEGHYAGFEWAERNDVELCGGNSTSFIEGCEEYLSQKEENEY